MQTIQDVIECCQQERGQYRRGIKPSPCCVELFRRAFDGNQDAWAGIERIFKPLMSKWIAGQNKVDVDDALQDAWISFFRAAPRQPSLVETDQLGSLLKYLQRCAKTSVLRLHRGKKINPDDIPVDEQVNLPVHLPDNETTIIQNEFQETLQERLDTLIQPGKEALVFELRFELGIKTQQIFDENQDLFEDYKEVAAIIQRLTRRLRKDPDLVELFHSRQNIGEMGLLQYSLDSSRLDENSLEGSVAQKKEQINMDEECVYSEVDILDYITNMASLDVVVGIEKSPACLFLANEMRNEMESLLAELYRRSCPSEEEIVSYQLKELSSPESLVMANHLKKCPACQEELRMVQAMERAAEEDENRPSVLRRIVAVLQPVQALPQPLRGKPLYYVAEQFHISLAIHRDVSHVHRWRLHGQVRTADRKKFDGLEEVTLLNPDSAATEIIEATNGSFLFTDLPRGQYQVSLYTPQVEIRIPAVGIGDER
ncbi:MAG: hypothetical protein AAF702_22355 [Chloroflexota bacterium]